MGYLCIVDMCTDYSIPWPSSLWKTHVHNGKDTYVSGVEEAVLHQSGKSVKHAQLSTFNH